MISGDMIVLVALGDGAKSGVFVKKNLKCQRNSISVRGYQKSAS